MQTLLNRLLIVIAFILLAMGLFGVAPSEQNVITQTILGEARSEGEAGMYAIACIIKRRMELKSFPSKAKKVCLEPSQFDYWTQRKRVKWDDQNRAAVRALMRGNSKEVRYARMLAANINRLDLSYINNADHYCTLKTHNYWTRGNRPVKVIGAHKFFKLRK